VSGRDDDAPPDVRTTSVEVDPATGEPRGERLPERPDRDGGLGPVAESVAVPHASRFHFVTGALVAVGVAAVAAAVLFVMAPVDTTVDGGARWAPWKPVSRGLDSGAREIADHVARRYRAPGGEQLVAVTGGPMEIQGLPMTIAKRDSPADGGNISLFEGRGVLYRLCGLGEKCAIDTGTATPERHLLLRREALELALYTFHDLDDVEHVVVFLPPKKGKDPSQALHFRRGDVRRELARPLQATLPGPVPTAATVDRSRDAPFVQRFTIANLFRFSLTQGNQDANVFLVLEPIPADPITLPGSASPGRGSSPEPKPTAPKISATGS
jgi:hypothetical protein